MILDENQEEIQSNYNKFIGLTVRLSLSLILSFSLIIKLHFHFANTLRFNRISLFNLVAIIAFVAIIWIRHPISRNMGLVLFSCGIYFSFEYEFFHNSSNIPPIVPTKEIYYFLQREGYHNALITAAHYLPYFLFILFLLLFLTDDRIKRYYRII